MRRVVEKDPCSKPPECDDPRPISHLQWLRYGPFLAQVVITRRCNLSCGYCFEFDKTSSPVPYDALEQRLEKLAELRTWALTLTGGEPTLHPELVRLVHKLRALRFRRRQMITNGFRLTRNLVMELNAAGLTDLQLSIDGVHRTPTTVKVLDGLDSRLDVLARHARFRVTVSAVIGSAPLAEARAVIAFARSRGFKPRIVLLHDQQGAVRLPAHPPTDYRRVVDALAHSGRDGNRYRERLMRGRTATFRCRAGSRYLYVDEFGLVHWCSQMREALSKPLLDYTLEDLARQFHTPKHCNPTCSIACARTASAYDEWRPQGSP